MGTLKDRLSWALIKKKDFGPASQSDLAQHVGVSRASVSDWFTGATKTLEGSNLLKAAEYLNLNPDWLATGKGEARPKKTSVGLTPIRTWEHQDDLPEGEYAFIPRLEINLSAGGGKEQIELEFLKEQPQAFRAEWIRRKRLKPSKLAVMYVVGDSMEDRLQDGDAVVVDTSQTDVVDGKVFALWYDGGERIKRLFRRPGGALIIHSDNDTKHPQMTLTPDEASHVRIIGRVVHISGDGGL